MKQVLYDLLYAMMWWSIILFILVIIILNTNDFLQETKKYNENDIRPGDLLMVSYSSKRGQLVKVFTGSSWTHVVLVVLHQGIKKIVEIAYYDDENKGVIMKPLKEWIECNNDRPLALRKYLGWKPFPNDKILLLVEKTKHYSQDRDLISWLKACLPHLAYVEPSKTEYYCSEYIVHLLQQVGILKKLYIPYTYKPYELAYVPLDTFPDTCYTNYPYMLQL